MKSRIFFLALNFFTGFCFAQQNAVEINGWTNINTFKCVNNAFKNSTSIYSFSGNDLPNLVLKVTDFDCKNRVMTADFRKTLNADQYPTLAIRFINFTINGSKFNAMVEVKMMNIVKKYNIDFSEYKNSLTGNKRIKFSDFNIVPPKKMGGIIYVKDDLDLRFSLAIKDQ